MTAVPKNPRVSELRELFRHLNAFRAVYEDTGLEDITTPQGVRWSLWDLEYLHSQLYRLTLRQRQAIVLCLEHNVLERDAAIAMGVSITNPVAMYATLGLQRLLDMIDGGELARFRDQRTDEGDAHSRRLTWLERMAIQIRARIIEAPNGCWLYPNPTPGPPALLLRSARSASGLMTVSPMKVMYRAYVGPVPEGCTVEHTEETPPFSIACVSPRHGVLNFSPQYKNQIQKMAARYIKERQVLVS
jgi:hypothetical protein